MCSSCVDGNLYVLYYFILFCFVTVCVKVCVKPFFFLSAWISCRCLLLDCRMNLLLAYRWAGSLGDGGERGLGCRGV
jgi:hypothetical protein